MDFAIALDSNSATPLYHQLYTELRQAILAGRLQPNQQILFNPLASKIFGYFS